MTHEQIPAASQTPKDTITTPVVNSPLEDRCSDRSSHLSAERDCHKNDEICLFEANTASKRRKLNRVQPSTTVPSHLQPCYPSYGTMQLTNVLKNTTVRYRISATQLKLHGIVCLDKGLLYLFPASLIPFSLAHSPELND